jgi:hypothetical protein
MQVEMVDDSQVLERWSVITSGRPGLSCRPFGQMRVVCSALPLPT